VVIDPGGGGAASYVERNFVGVRAISCAERGFGHACNRALETVDARYVLFLDSRHEACAGSLDTLVSALDSRPEVAAAGVRQVHGDGSAAPSTGRFPSALHAMADALGLARVPGARRVLGERELDARRYERARGCEWTSGPLLVRVSALQWVGWFDERLFHLAGEIDLCQRLRRAGWGVLYMPCLTARRHEPSQREAARLAAQAAYGRMQLARKHFPYLAADYRWALAVFYALRLARCTLSRRLDGERRQAARAALSTVLRGRVPLAERSAL